MNQNPNHRFWPTLFKLLRVRQWIKNVFVLAPLMFSGAFHDLGSVQTAFIAALLFCLVSSAVYILNDIHDRAEDSRHPVKSRTRPLAYGGVSVWQALVVMLGLWLLAGALAWMLPLSVVVIMLAYLMLATAYTFWLKDQPVLDIFTIALGFVLRIYAGALAIGVVVSPWMFVTTLSLALYLAAIKRRQELRYSGVNTRKVLVHYTESLVQRYAEMSATGALVFYSLFVVSERPELVVTIPVVLYGLFRYWYVVETYDAGESPTDALLSDWQLSATVLLWAGITAVVI